jgi:uncharacterized protein (DUF433 family)
VISIAEQSMLEIGIYSPREAARYVRADTQRLRRWMYGTKNSAPVFDPDIPREGTREIVTFLDFAQALQVQDIRLNIGIPLQKIREAYEHARDKYGIDHPFATEKRILVFGDVSVPTRCSLVLCQEEEIGNQSFLDENAKKYVQLTGKKKGNILISEVVRAFSKNLIYSPRGVADSYAAYMGVEHRILIDPKVRFGKPHIDGLVYEADTLANAAKNEGSVHKAADLFEVPESAVQAALDYMEELNKAPPKLKPTKIETIVA